MGLAGLTRRLRGAEKAMLPMCSALKRIRSLQSEAIPTMGGKRLFAPGLRVLSVVLICGSWLTIVAASRLPVTLSGDNDGSSARGFRSEMPSRSPDHVKKVLSFQSSNENEDGRKNALDPVKIKQGLLQFLQPEFEISNRFQDKGSPMSRWLSLLFDPAVNTNGSLKIGDWDKCPDEFIFAHYEGGNPNWFWTCYHSLKSIDNFMENLARKHPEVVSVEVIGQSSEGRPMKVLKISTSKSKRLFWIDGGIHAREWIAPAVATYVAHELVNNYDAHKEIVDAFTWYIAPVLNVDGYEFSRNEDRMWRKTRTKANADAKCVGIDPNRNFDYMWMVGGSQDPCSPIYAGPAPETEPLVIALRDYIRGLKANGELIAFYTLHAYGQLWGCPWGYTNQIVPRTFNLLMRVANAGTTALGRLYGTKYDTGTTAQIGLIGGAADDWAFAVAKVPFVYTIELRDTGEHTFMLPAAQILPTAQETFVGIKASAAEIIQILAEIEIFVQFHGSPEKIYRSSTSMTEQSRI